MTLTPGDVVHLGWDDSLSLAGVTYVERNLARLSGGTPPPTFALRRTVASVAAELAFRRYADREGIAYALLDGEPFTRPEWPRLLIGGRRLHLETRLLSSRRTIRHIRRDPSVLLDLPLSVSRMELDSDTLSEGDLVAFAILLGLETRTLTELQRAVAAGLPVHLVAHAPDASWSHPADELALGHVCVTNLSQPMELVIQGALANQTPWREPVALDHAASYRSPPLYALLALHTLALPQAEILVASENRASPWRLRPGGWENIWLYGMEVLLLGWTTAGEFRRMSTMSPPSPRASWGLRPPPGSYSAPSQALRPAKGLLAHLHQP
jgi:hypothetical protein